MWFTSGCIWVDMCNEWKHIQCRHVMTNMCMHIWVHNWLWYSVLHHLKWHWFMDLMEHAYAPCRNPSLGLATKAKGLQGCGPRGSPGITSHALGSVRKCEGVNPHIPKATPTFGDGVPVDSQNFREWFQRSKLNGLWRSLYHWKALRTYMSKMGSHCSFGHLKHKLWPKEGPGVKLPIWLLTRKSWESTWFT
jgi:hypothetical protein